MLSRPPISLYPLPAESALVNWGRLFLLSPGSCYQHAPCLTQPSYWFVFPGLKSALIFSFIQFSMHFLLTFQKVNMVVKCLKNFPSVQISFLSVGDL